MESLSPVAARFSSLAQLRAYNGTRKSLMSAPMDFTPEALAYANRLELGHGGRADRNHPALIGQSLTIHDRAGELSADRVESLLQDGLPSLPGKKPFVTRLVEAHKVFNEIKLARFGELATVFSLEIGRYVPAFNWHRDETAIITLRGSATCWLPDENQRNNWRMMDQRSFNIWDKGILHSGPNQHLNTEPRLLAVMI